MQTHHLKRDQLWDGKLYLAGDRLIPDDLAIALGLVKPEPAEEPTEPLEQEEKKPVARKPKS